LLKYFCRKILSPPSCTHQFLFDLWLDRFFFPFSPSHKAVIANSWRQFALPLFLPDFNILYRCTVLLQIFNSREELIYVRFFLEEKRTKKFKNKLSANALWSKCKYF